MHRNTQWLCAAVALSIVGLVASSAAAQTHTRTIELRDFQVVSVEGNKVVVKGPQGAREVTVPEGFQFTVDGREVSVAELKPGMTGSATITTTTTVTPVTVTQVKNGDVVKVTGNSIIVRTGEGIRMFSEGDARERGVTILRDGQPLAFTDLHEGDKLSATIVTHHPPKVMTQRDVQARLSSPAAPAPARAPTPASTPAPSRAPASTSPSAGSPAPMAPVSAMHTSDTARHLPKTASSLPLVGILGAVSLATGLLLAMHRRRIS